MLKYLVTFIIMILFASTVEAKSLPLEGKLSLGVNDASGNTNKSALKFEGEIKKVIKQYERGSNDSIQAEYEYKYSKTDGITKERKGKGSLRLDKHLGKKWSLRAIEKISFNDFQDLQYRIEEILGFSYFLVDREKIKYSLNLGVARIDSEYDTIEDQGYFALPIGWEFEWNFYRELLLTHELEWSAEVGDFSTYIFEAITELAIPIDEQWSLDFKHEISINSNPPPDKKEADRSLSLKLSYHF